MTLGLQGKWFIHYAMWLSLPDEQDQESSEEREYDIRFITPGGRKITMSNARRKCKDTSTDFAGWDAVRSNDMHLNTPSWVDVSRYVISNIRNKGKSGGTLLIKSNDIHLNAPCLGYVSGYVISNIIDNSKSGGTLSGQTIYI